jgi:hypothetical protein
MKRTKLFLATLIAAVAFVSSAHALPEATVASLKKAVATLPVPELAAKAAEAVKETKAQDRQEMALTAVRTIISQKPASAPAVVAAIAKAAPEVSAAAAAEAARLSPEQSVAIAKAAAFAAPVHADKIAAAVASVTPKTARAVTHAVVMAVPSAAPQIVEDVIAAVPAARTQIENDEAITRISRSFASAPGTSGNIETFPGTIRGTIPGSAPTPVTVITPGEDSDRQNYGSPR